MKGGNPSGGLIAASAMAAAVVVLSLVACGGTDPFGSAADASDRMASASKSIARALARCPHRPGAFRCVERQERVLSTVFDRYARDMSRLDFSGSDKTAAAAVVRDAHVIARDLVIDSKAKTSSAFLAAHSNTDAEGRRLLADTKVLFGMTR